MTDVQVSEAASRPARAKAEIAARNIPIFNLKRQQRRMHDKLMARMSQVLDHCQFVFGPEVEELERAVAKYCGARHAIAVSSGRDALMMALMALGTGPGDAVFIPSFTFSATAGAVAAVGAAPVFVDVDETTFNMDPADFERAAARVAKEGTLKLKAVMPVDLYGLAADYDAIGQVAAKYGITVVADAAQSFGGTTPAGRVGTLAPVSATSFYPTKPLGGYGDGGALFTDDDEIADAIRLIRTHGRQGNGDEALRLGMTGRLDTLQAAVLMVKLEEFDAELAARERIASAYHAALSNRAVTPRLPKGHKSAWALYTLRVEDRDRVREELAGEGVGTGLFYPRPLHQHAAFKPWVSGRESLPVSERLAGEVLSLPIYGDLSDDEVAYVCDKAADIL